MGFLRVGFLPLLCLLAHGHHLSGFITLHVVQSCSAKPCSADLVTTRCISVQSVVLQPQRLLFSQDLSASLVRRHGTRRLSGVHGLEGKPTLSSGGVIGVPGEMKTLRVIGVHGKCLGMSERSFLGEKMFRLPPSRGATAREENGRGKVWGCFPGGGAIQDRSQDVLICLSS